MLLCGVRTLISLEIIEMAIKVDSEHPEYTKHKKKWQLVRDAIDSCVDHHIIPPCFNKDRRSLWRNENYIKRAVFDNYTINTRLGLVGTALREDPTIELPPELDYIEEDATCNGLTLKQVIRKALGENIEVGRYGGFVDYPNVSLGLSGEQVAALGLKTKIHLFPTEDILDWQVEDYYGNKYLSLVKLREKVTRRLDDFTTACAWQYKILKLDDNGVYYYYLTDIEHKIVSEPIYPRQNGKLMDHIPFYFLGAEDNDPEVDNSPLYPIAHVNIGHLRNSASYEDNLDAHAQGTLIVTSTMSGSEWREHTQQRPFMMGSREGHYIGQPGSDAKLLQLQAGQELASAMRQKEEQMTMMGAYMLIKENSSNISTDTSKMQIGPKVSRLDTLVTNTEDWLKDLLEEVALFEGANPELIVVQLSHNFIPENADPLVMAQLAAQWQSGLIPHGYVLDYDRKVDLIPRDVTNEEIIAEINKESPMGIGVGFSGNQQTPQYTTDVTNLNNNTNKTSDTGA